MHTLRKQHRKEPDGMLEDRLLQVLQDNEGQVAKVLSTLQEHGVKITDVSVQNKSIRDNYFDRHKDLYDKLEENCFEDVEVDRARWIRNDRDIDGTCSVEDLEFAFDAITIAPCHDSEFNFGAVSTPVNPRANQTELLPTEATHPQTQGYLQMADIMYSVLCKVY